MPDNSASSTGGQAFALSGESQPTNRIQMERKEK